MEKNCGHGFTMESACSVCSGFAAKQAQEIREERGVGYSWPVEPDGFVDAPKCPKCGGEHKHAMPMTATPHGTAANFIMTCGECGEEWPWSLHWTRNGEIGEILRLTGAKSLSDAVAVLQDIVDSDPDATRVPQAVRRLYSDLRAAARIRLSLEAKIPEDWE